MLKILIVDDNAAVRQLIAAIVQPLATDIRECLDGDGALAAFQEYRPDLILMDIQMPRMDGIEATKLIHNAEPAARIVIVTDYDDAGLRESALNAGALDYVTKDNLLNVFDLIKRFAT